MADSDRSSDTIGFKRAPFTQCPNIWLSRLTVSEIVLAFTLGSFASRETGECWPSQKTIEESCPLSRTTIKKAMAGLVEKGVVRSKRRYSEAYGNTSNHYIVDLTGNNFFASEASDKEKTVPPRSENDQGVQNFAPDTDVLGLSTGIQPESGNQECGFMQQSNECSTDVQGLGRKTTYPWSKNDLPLVEKRPLTISTELEPLELDEMNKTKNARDTSKGFQIPPDLVEYTELLNDWIRYRQEKTRLTKKNEYTSIAFERDCNKIRCTKQNNVSLAEVTKVVDQAINAGWVTFYIDKLTSKQTKPVTTKPDFDFIPSSSMAVPKVSPRDALVAKYEGKDVYMRLEEDGPIYITALHKADGVTGGLNDDYMVELWIDGKPRYIDYAEVESLMTTKEEYEGWNAFLNLF